MRKSRPSAHLGLALLSNEPPTEGNEATGVLQREHLGRREAWGRWRSAKLLNHFTKHNGIEYGTSAGSSQFPKFSRTRVFSLKQICYKQTMHLQTQNACLGREKTPNLLQRHGPTVLFASTLQAIAQNARRASLRRCLALRPC